jgi:DNA-binding response OmpR family regulator
MRLRSPSQSRAQLIDLVKGREWAAYDGVDIQVMRLRKKTEPDPRNPSLIKTVRGSGYVFAAAAVGVTLPSTNVRSPGSYDG